MSLECVASSIHKPSSSRALNWAATKRIFDASWVTCLRTNRAGVAELRVQVHDRLAAEQPVLGATEA